MLPTTQVVFVKHVGQLIDRVHCGPRKEYAVTCGVSKDINSDGVFIFREEAPDDPIIRVREEAQFLNFILAHEIGHLVDVCLIHNGSSQVASNPLFDSWRKAVEKSFPYQYLQNAEQTGILYERSSEDQPQKVLASAEDLKHIVYLLKWHELWGRCYAQYIALYDTSTPIYQEWQGLLYSGKNYKFQYVWEADDDQWIPIGREMSDIFRKLGWLHHVT